VLERNPYYRGGRPANVDRVVWAIGTSKPACLRATEANRVDHCVLYGIPESAYPRLVARYGVNRPGGQFFVSPRLDAHYFAFNHDRPAFKGRAQIPLKKAINFALDRAALARTFGYLGGSSDDQLLPPSMGKDVQIYPLRRPDPVTARTWLDRAGLKPEKLVLYAFNDRAGTVAAAEAFVTSLKGIGIDVDVKYFDQQVFSQKTGTRGEPFDVALVAWSVDYADPASFFDPLLNGDNITATGNQNVSYFDEPAVNARIRAANELSGDARRRAWADLDADLMRDDPPWAPFFHTTRANFVSRSFGCFLSHPFYGVDIAAACKK
jgi:peptide/nickel transport system substrate-binding protein